MWAVPWTTDAIINTVFLALATLVVAAVPVVYATFANLRDPLARALFAGTGATALVFTVSLIVTFAFHMGWNPNAHLLNWLTRLTYVAVASGKATLLVSLLMERRRARRLAVAVAADVAAERRGAVQ